MHGKQKLAYYISIAGASKQPAIDRLKKSKLNLILAVVMTMPVNNAEIEILIYNTFFR